MAKRYYWLKLKDDFFTKREIKKLRRLAGGDTYTIVYLKMLLMAAKTDGVLTWTGLEENFAEELSIDLDEKAEDVEVTLAYLLKTGLAETQAGVNYFLPYVFEVVGSESDSAERVRRYRERQALQSNALPSQCNKEIEKREEIQDTRDKNESESTGAPTLEDVRAYALEIGSNVDPERFCDYYAAEGWLSKSGNPITDWRAKLRSWAKTEQTRPAKADRYSILDKARQADAENDPRWANVHYDIGPQQFEE